MPDNCLVLDIESVPNELFPLWKNPLGKDFPPPIYHRIVCIGYALFSDEGILSTGVLGLDESEQAGLQKLCKMIEHNRPMIVTWNGRAFDMPVISYRCLKYGIATGWDFAGEYRHRHKAKHFDIADYVTNHGAVDRVSLDTIACLIGMPGKIDTRGSDVSDLIARQKLVHVGSYCLQDVFTTMLVFLRYSHLMGKFTQEETNRGITKLQARLASYLTVNMQETDLSGKCNARAARALLDSCDFRTLLI